MKLNNTSLGMLAAAVAAFSAPYATAGNIPQYEFNQFDSEFKYLEDATLVNNTFREASDMLFLGDRVYSNPYVGQGYPIGFDFKYGGQVFNQFVIDNNGCIMLGNDKVSYYGYNSLFFSNATRYASNYFYLGMTPIIFGIKAGEISYKNEGPEGDRRLIVEFKNMQFRENSIRGQATYSSQIVLHEKTGIVDLNFLEEEAAYASVGLTAGIYGWSLDDSLILTAEGLGSPVSVSPLKESSMLKKESYIYWDINDELGYDHMDPYSYTLRFTPTGEQNFVSMAPTGLMADQTGDTFNISCKRPADAPATMILISETPFTDQDLPTEGLSYQVKNDAGEYVTKFGNATLIYYGDAEYPTTTFSKLKPAIPYYIKAIGVNGYPSYSVASAADIEIYSSHAAPTLLKAVSGNGLVSLTAVGEHDIIVGATYTRVNTANEGTTGIFGFPEADSKVGDQIPGGGEVIYVGPAEAFDYTDVIPNRQVFFRAWSLLDGRVSKTSVSATGITNGEYPFDPCAELFTLNEPLIGWTSATDNSDKTIEPRFHPAMRGENETEPALCGISTAGTYSAMISPTLEIPEGAKLSFEWALETVVIPVQDPNSPVVLPEGNRPGEFGLGHKFEVTCGTRGTGTTLFSTDKYTGSMKESHEEGKYVSGTSDFIPVKVDMPAGKLRLQFRFSTEGTSYLYLRNILVADENYVGIEGTEIFGAEDQISASNGVLSILSAKGGNYPVCSLDGRLVANPTLGAGETVLINLPAGFYIAGGKKVIIK